MKKIIKEIFLDIFSYGLTFIAFLLQYINHLFPLQSNCIYCKKEIPKNNFFLLFQIDQTSCLKCYINRKEIMGVKKIESRLFLFRIEMLESCQEKYAPFCTSAQQQKSFYRFKKRLLKMINEYITINRIANGTTCGIEQVRMA
mgnify:CR=1 FL=1